MFAEVALPRSRLDCLTYEVPADLAEQVRVGSAVRVELRNRRTDAIVTALTPSSGNVAAKPLLDVIEPEFCPPALLRLINWVRQYYIATWGEALTLALPGKVIGYRPRSAWTPPQVSVPTGTAPVLTLDQHRAVRRILQSLSPAEFRAFLVFGVTGSGKTEIYLRVAEAALQQDKSVIVLVPEIALTPLLMSRFEERFPGRLVALHSGLTAARRKVFWQALRDGRARLVVGARSAVFAPVRNLGLIVVDEEHDTSYKEQERMPHYNARDVAVVRGKLEKAPVVLASATPSVETFFHARRGAYELLSLPSRIGNRPLPRAAIISLRRPRRTDRSRVFTRSLVEALQARAGTAEQAILFVNRRGFARQLACADCGHVPTCRYCGIPLVFHAEGRNLQCHFCRFILPAFDACPQCHGTHLEYSGVGTQQVCLELQRLLPGSRVLRMDRDITRRPDAIQQTLDAFGQGQAQFLVGTQMVTKGFDFPGVTLSAVVSADGALNLPDFRSAERTFQVLTQVAGRAGRGDLPGQAIFQTRHPDHYAVNCAARQDYARFFEQEIAFRRRLAYPPFSRLALVRIISPNPAKCTRVGETLRARFEAQPGLQVLGPIPAFRKKKRNLHIYLLLLRAKPNLRLHRIIDPGRLDFPGTRVDLDIDPLEIL